MAILIEKVLRGYGYDGDVQEFREIIREMHALMHPNWTDEDLLFHPRPEPGTRESAATFCDAVNKRFGLRLPDHVILRTLVNRRKNDHGPGRRVPSRTKKAKAR